VKSSCDCDGFVHVFIIDSTAAKRKGIKWIEKFFHIDTNSLTFDFVIEMFVIRFGTCSKQKGLRGATTEEILSHFGTSDNGKKNIDNLQFKLQL